MCTFNKKGCHSRPFSKLGRFLAHDNLGEEPNSVDVYNKCCCCATYHNRVTNPAALSSPAPLIRCDIVLPAPVAMFILSPLLRHICTTTELIDAFNGPCPRSPLNIYFVFYYLVFQKIFEIRTTIDCSTLLTTTRQQ